MTVLITGATRGIGLALAQCAADRGDQVIATYRGSLPSQSREIDWHMLDVTDPQAHRQLSDRLAAKPLSILKKGISSNGITVRKTGQRLLLSMSLVCFSQSNLFCRR